MDRVDIRPIAGAEPQVGVLLAALDNTTREWRGELGGLSVEQITWQVFPDGHSIGGLFLHIADVEAHWLFGVATGTTRCDEELSGLLTNQTNQYALEWPTPPSEPLEWYFALQDSIRERTHKTVLGMNDPEHLSVRRETEFTLRWLLGHVIAHEAYHGGQAVLLSLIQQKGTGQTEIETVG